MNTLRYLVLSSILIAISLLAPKVYAQEKNITAAEEPKFLAIQHARSGSISKINDTTSTLELNNISKKTILFTDRPDRIVMSMSTNDFIGNWSVGADSFAEDAPNAVLVIDDSEKQDDVIIELFNPVYDTNTNTLIYTVRAENGTLIDLPREFGQSTVVIDESNNGYTGGQDI